MIFKTLLKTSICLICFVCLWGCGEEKPKDVLSEDVMINILLDVYQGEGKVSGLQIKRDSSLAVFEVYQQRIFEKHKVDKGVYKKSLTYYYNHPAVLEGIYESVLDSLSIKEQKLKEAQEKERQERAEESNKKTEEEGKEE